MLDKSEAINGIYEIIKKVFGDSVKVEILVNSEGIKCTPTYMPFTVDYSMRTINGEWLERRESE